MNEHDQEKARAKRAQWEEHNRAKAEALAKRKEAHDSAKAQAIGTLRQLRSIRGVRDILPAETALWNYAEQTARDVFAAYSFSEIRLPIIEPTELFARSIGLDTDVVSKEMFSFWDPFDLRLRPELALQEAQQRGMKVQSLDDLATLPLAENFQQISLRPEATASVCRAYIEHGMHSLPAPVRLYYMGAMFR